MSWHRPGVLAWCPRCMAAPLMWLPSGLTWWCRGCHAFVPDK